MHIVTVSDLRKKTVTIIHSTINLSRGLSKSHPESIKISEKELEKFIESIPYFEEELKKFLLESSSEMKVFMVDGNWYSMFVGFISSWAHGPEWLGDNIFGFEENLTESILADSLKLHLPFYFDNNSA